VGSELFQGVDKLGGAGDANVTDCPPVSSARRPLASASLLRRGPESADLRIATYLVVLAA
jgi:hypothetical protein